MNKIQWHIEVGDKIIDGKESVQKGIIRIHCDAPSGIIRKVTAGLHYNMGEDERLFMNGYQTWTYCPEYKKHDKIRGLGHLPEFLINKFSFDRYGDYHFINYPNKPGLFHGFSYCYFRKGDKYRLFASLDESFGYTIFKYDSNKGILKIERDCKGVEHSGGELPAFDLYFAQGNEKEVFDGWFSAMGLNP